MSMPYRKKLIEVALPLEAINRASGTEKSIRHGHPSTLHLWWARRPLAAARAILFAQLVDDPSAWPERFPTEEDQARERKRLFSVIEAMVPWAASNDAVIIGRARLEIAQSWARSHPSDKATRVLLVKAPIEGDGDATRVSIDSPDGGAVIDDYLATELPPVHDPFAGGGSIPLEAQRLGLRAIATDLNPVAVLINKALIEIPPRFAGQAPVNPGRSAEAAEATTSSKRRKSKQGVLARAASAWRGAEGLAEDVRYYGTWMREQAKAKIGHLYPDATIQAADAEGRPEMLPLAGKTLTTIAWLWARTVASPDPAFSGIHVPLISSYWLSTKLGKETWVKPVVDTEGKTYRFVICTGDPGDAAARELIGQGTKLGRGANFRCVLSGAPVAPDYIKAEGSAGRMSARMLAVVADGDRSRMYLAPRPEMEAIALTAAPEWAPDGDVPKRLTGGTCHAYGLSTWGKLFTARQLVALVAFSDLVLAARKQAVKDALDAGLSADPRPLRDDGTGAIAYGDAVATYLSCCHSAMLDDLSTLVTWRPSHGTGATRTTFARQALPMTWDYAEANPFAEAGGDMASSAIAIAKVLDNLPPDGYRAGTRVEQADAVVGTVAGALISTDPPYYDNIGYADLSDFFYVWLRRTLIDVFPRELTTVLVPKTAELIAAPYRHGGRDKAKEFFQDGMTRALSNMARNTVPGVPAAVYYAFKQTESDEAGESSTGWETFLEAVIAAGFEVHGTWPIRTEKAGRSVEIGSNALASSVILACSPRPVDAETSTRTDFRRSLSVELPVALRALQASGIAPVDVAQAAIGPGMAIFSRYAKVLEPDGKPMTVRSALRVINEMLDEHLTAHEGNFDSHTRFAVTWYESHGFESGPYGDAETLATARAVAIGGMAEAGILKSGGGKVRLLKRSELPGDWDPSTDARLTVWEAAQHLIKQLEEHGEEAAAALLAKLGAHGDAARDLAYRLYSTCERKKWAEEARAYNGLVVAWPDLERLASSHAKSDTGSGQQSLL